MEAASARYAARDRFGGFAEPAQTQLQRYIQNAVDPQNYEPNLALDLEISDLINSKKGNAPREAAVAIVNYVNHRNANVSLLALTLLDICVKNCGYPFHLQISTKEFLNELVRRFPERPPIRPSRVQLKILEEIEEWRQTICQTSRYKEDLGFVRDMHRLLSYKGYIFPEVRREDAAVLNPSDNLQSADEMEEEEKAAQSAKLQELIRRGGPEDLQEANRLMKVMAGYDTKHKTDYRAKAAEEVSKIQQKAKLLEERLQNFKSGDEVADGDIFEELANALSSAQPKIQKMCEEESEDSEAVAKLLEINDSIHRTIERYKLIKKGDVEAASKIPQGTLGTSTGVTKTADNELSLIDFDGEEPSPDSNTNAAGSSTQQAASLQDDLLGLSVQDQDYGQSGGIALGFGANSSVPGPSLLSSTTQQNSAQGSVPNLASKPQQAPVPTKPNYDPFSSFASSHVSSRSTTPAPPSLSQSQTLSQPPPPAPSNSDPFASLSSTAPRQPSPLPQAKQSQFPAPSPSASLFDFASAKPPPTPQVQAAPASHPNSNGATADDDWDFASALPDDAALPSANELVVSNSPVHITFHVNRSGPKESTVHITASFSNKTSSLITEYTFQVAVTKDGDLRLYSRQRPTLALDCARTLFELHAGREVPQLPQNLFLGQLTSTSPRQETWYNTSEALIEALGPIGIQYAKPKQYSSLLDLSHTSAVLAAFDREQAIEDAEEAKMKQKQLKEDGKYGFSRKEILTKYLCFIHPVLECQDRLGVSTAESTQIHDGLLRVFDRATSRWLGRRGLGITDVMDWAWILTADTSLCAAMKLTEVAKRPAEGAIIMLPHFLFNFVLRRQDMSAAALNYLLVYIWKAMGQMESPQSSPLQESTSKDINTTIFIKDGTDGMSERVFIIMIIRLLRHARKVWPAACQSIVALLCRYMNGLNFQKVVPQDQEPYDVIQLTYVYNTILKILASPSNIHPFQSAFFQQRAQFSIVRRMDQFKPPLVVDKRGYQAVVKMQLMHKKTLKEREWAYMKARSWPPWKEEKLGIDAAIGAESGNSRAKEVLTRAKVAGYATDEWDAAAGILSGWETDYSPTIQTRSDLKASSSLQNIRTLRKRLSSTSDNKLMTSVQIDSEKAETDGQPARGFQGGLVRAARIRATRTLDEAWSSFLACKADKVSPPVGPLEYYAMFVKIEQTTKKRPQATIQDPHITREEQVLPGDGLELQPAPTSPKEATYVWRPPPTADGLLEEMKDDKVKPSGRFLCFLLAKAWSFEAGVRCLEASVLLHEQLSALLGAYSSQNGHCEMSDELRSVLVTIPSDILEAFISFMTRFAPMMPDEGAHHRHTTIQTGLMIGEWAHKYSDKDSPRAHSSSSPPQVFNPLDHALRLLYEWQPHHRSAWYHILRALARPRAVTTVHSTFASQHYHDLKTWRMTCQLLDHMFEIGLCVDTDGLVILCKGLEKAIFACEHLRISQSKGVKISDSTNKMIKLILCQGLPLVKGIFKDAVRAEGMQHEIKAHLASKKKASKSTAENNTDQKAFLPPGCLIPKLLEIPSPGQLHAFIRVLGLRRDYEGLLDLIEWMSQFADEIDSFAKESSNGRRMMRRCIIAIRVFLGRSWLDVSRDDGISCTGNHGIVLDADPAKPELVEAIENVIKEHHHWGGWATDDEVREYCANGRFV